MWKRIGSIERERKEGGRWRNYTGGDQHIYHCRCAKLKLKWKSQSLAHLGLQGHTLPVGSREGSEEGTHRIENGVKATPDRKARLL